MYLTLAMSKEPPDEIYKPVEGSTTTFTATRENVMKFAEFMHQRGTIKAKLPCGRNSSSKTSMALPGVSRQSEAVS